MPTLKPLRVVGLIVSAALGTALAACSSSTAAGPTSAPPTLAPEQSVSDACAVSKEEVERISAEAEAQIRAGLDQAGQDVLAGDTPSFDFLVLSVGDSLAEVQSQITNSEVLAAVEAVRSSLAGFGEIEQPETPLGVPGYLAKLGTQLGELTTAGKELQTLCTAG